MKITILGSTGRIGRLVLEQALEDDLLAGSDLEWVAVGPPW